MSVETNPTEVALPTPESDWFTPLLKCVACHNGELMRCTDRYLCIDCKTTYPVSNNVPMLLSPLSYVDAAAIIARDFGEAEPNEIAAALATAVRYQMKNPVLRSEFSNIADRHAASLGLDSTFSDNLPETGIELKAEYFNPGFDLGKVSYRTIRIKNNTNITFNSDLDQPYYLSYHLYPVDGSGPEIEGIRSRFPIPLKPGAELSIPMAIKAPLDKGTYLIRVEIVHEYVRWFHDWKIFEGNIEVLEIQKSDNIIRHENEGYFDFEGDLAQCGVVIQRATKMLTDEKGCDEHVVLEMACGSDPQSLRHYQLGTKVVACDICFPQVQIASIAMRRLKLLPQDHIRFAAADTLEIPFRAGVFDLIIISAALHHITNVTDALRTFRSLLKSNGKIVLLREPCAVAPDAPVYIQELERGFNEQQFELPEYVEMFKRTGLRPVYEQIDYECSYKAILEIGESESAPPMSDVIYKDTREPPEIEADTQEIYPKKRPGFIQRFFDHMR